MWWCDIFALRQIGWFSDNVCRSLGNGKHTLFWTDVWIGGLSLSVRFSRLYDLSMFKESSVFHMSHLGWGEDGGAWRWRRRLFVWEEQMVGELLLLLHNVLLQVVKADSWLWTLETCRSYSVRSAYRIITISPPLVNPVPVADLWHKDVPLKVVLFAWRLLRDRLPTKENLYHRGVLDRDSILCAAGCDLVESSQHLFLHCNIFGSVWHLIYRWLGISAVVPSQVSAHFTQFSVSGGVGNKRRSITQVIWFATVWEIWKERNNRLFNDKQGTVTQVVDRIKSLTFRWLKAKYVTLPFNYHGRWLSPFTMLGIG